MPIDAELLTDRRRLRRKLSFWRIVAILLLIAGVVTAGVLAAGRGSLKAIGPQIARIKVDGFISGDERMKDLFKRVAESPTVAGVVVSINSPGGTTTGAEELFHGIRDLAAKKPTVAFVDGMAASGGYITAIATDHIVARETAIVGSIGVLFQYPDFSKLLDTVGVAVDEVKSAPLKAEPSPFHKASPEARAVLQNVVADTFAWFKGLVADRRRMTEPEVAAVSDGRIYSGRQSVPLRLIDEVGDERTAIGWLEGARGVAKDLPVRDWKPRRAGGPFDLLTTAAAGADLLGFEALAARLRRLGPALTAANLDGMLAVWQPAAAEK